LWTTLWDICVTWYNRVWTVVQDNWDRYVSLIKMFWETLSLTGKTLWATLWDICVTLYTKVRWVVVDKYTRLFYLLETQGERLVTFLGDPAWYIWAYILIAAEDTVKSKTVQFQSTCEHCLRYLWEGVW
jgi:hypothetical protein